jgi:hypothetical protein
LYMKNEMMRVSDWLAYVWIFCKSSNNKTNFNSI